MKLGKHPLKIQDYLKEGLCIESGRKREELEETLENIHTYSISIRNISLHITRQAPS